MIGGGRGEGGEEKGLGEGGGEGIKEKRKT